MLPYIPLRGFWGDELQSHHKNRVKTQELLQVSNWKLFLLKQTEYCITTSFNVSLKIEPLCGTLEWSFKKVKVANSSHDFLDALIKASSIKMHQELLLLQLTTYSTKNSISQREALSCKRTTTMLLLFTTDWIFFPSIFFVCQRGTCKFWGFFISYFVCRIWSMHHESSSPKCSRSNPNNNLITAIHQLG